MLRDNLYMSCSIFTSDSCISFSIWIIKTWQKLFCYFSKQVALRSCLHYLQHNMKNISWMCGLYWSCCLSVLSIILYVFFFNVKQYRSSSYGFLINKNELQWCHIIYLIYSTLLWSYRGYSNHDNLSQSGPVIFYEKRTSTLQFST